MGMASVKHSASSGAMSARGSVLKTACGALLCCSVIAGAAWGIGSTFKAMHEAARTLAEAPVHLKLALTDGPRLTATPKPLKAARVFRRPDSEIAQELLTPDAIRLAHQRGQFTRLALADKRRTAEEAKAPVEIAALTTGSIPKTPSLKPAPMMGPPSAVTALVENLPVQEMQPFDLVLKETETKEEGAYLGPAPLPEPRPLIETAKLEDEPPAEDKPAARNAPQLKPQATEEKPRRSLFGSLFGNKGDDGRWPGHGTKVAIYDVSNATVYLPDGTKLRAHSGIGKMRDNPRYEHVKMNGPTPAGIYRLSMRESRFYGVEAIRMTSIDGRDPKNRTGLLTHTNLLRGQIGSHGCVAFQNYEPFLKAFKRGHVTMMVVVPELPSSNTRLAALYRKAGA